MKIYTQNEVTDLKILSKEGNKKVYMGTIDNVQYAFKKLCDYKYVNYTPVNGENFKEILILKHLNKYVKLGCVELIGLYIGDQYVYIIFELLSVSMHKKYIGVDDAVLTHEEIFKMIESLNELHSCGVVHNDIKPANIMHDANGNIKFIDFGLANLYGLNPSKSTTDNYMCSEITKAPDMYSDNTMNNSSIKDSYNISKIKDYYGDCTEESYIKEYINMYSVYYGKQYKTYLSDVWSLGATILCLIFNFEFKPIITLNGNLIQIRVNLCDKESLIQNYENMDISLLNMINDMMHPHMNKRLSCAQILDKYYNMKIYQTVSYIECHDINNEKYKAKYKFLENYRMNIFTNPMYMHSLYERYKHLSIDFVNAKDIGNNDHLYHINNIGIDSYINALIYIKINNIIDEKIINELYNLYNCIFNEPHIIKLTYNKINITEHTNIYPIWMLFELSTMLFKCNVPRELLDTIVFPISVIKFIQYISTCKENIKLLPTISTIITDVAKKELDINLMFID
jgi:serine/threonine protein kinase